MKPLAGWIGAPRVREVALGLLNNGPPEFRLPLVMLVMMEFGWPMALLPLLQPIGAIDLIGIEKISKLRTEPIMPQPI